MFQSSFTKGVVGFGGSRHGYVQEADMLVAALAQRQVSFVVGCASGVDFSFREALVAFASRTTIYCAFPAQEAKFTAHGFSEFCTIACAVSPAAALHRRTVNMVWACTHLVLFPDNPRTGAWGRGSRLAFNTAIERRKRIFVATSKPLPFVGNGSIRVSCTSLFGVVSGYLVEPVAREVAHAT